MKNLFNSLLEQVPNQAQDIVEVTDQLLGLEKQGASEIPPVFPAKQGSHPRQKQQ